MSEEKSDGNAILRDGTRLVIEGLGMWNDGTLTAVADAGAATISVSQEHAVDSYNQEFECSIDLGHEAMVALRDLLSAALALYDASKGT